MPASVQSANDEFVVNGKGVGQIQVLAPSAAHSL
jgi:hypothetical protein